MRSDKIGSSLQPAAANSAVLDSRSATKGDAEALVSVVVVPREGFRRAPGCLRNLLQVTRTPFRLIYVDGGSPAWIRGRLERMLKSSGGTLIRSRGYLRPTRARNLALCEVTTRYTVFLDNDVLVTQGWLEGLLSVAEQKGAAYVSPVICTGGRTPPLVHVAGGVNELFMEKGHVRLREEAGHARQKLPEVPLASPRPTTMAEFHAILVRTDVLRSLGGLDEGCSTAFEHNDLCLSIAALGKEGWLSPTSVVDYLPDRSGLPGNTGYHLVRWSKRWIEESLSAFCTKWGLEPDDPALLIDLEALNYRRRRPIAFLRAVVRRLLGEGAVQRLDRLADWYVERLFHSSLDHREPPLEVFRW